MQEFHFNTILSHFITYLNKSKNKQNRFSNGESVKEECSIGDIDDRVLAESKEGNSCLSSKLPNESVDMIATEETSPSEEGMGSNIKANEVEEDTIEMLKFI